MIDWDLTTIQFGITPESKLGKRPKIVCKCDNCPKTTIITVRTKKRLKEGFPWKCYSCVNRAKSDEISLKVKSHWLDQTYRQNQDHIHQSASYRENLSNRIRQKWTDTEYRKKLAVGINREEFIRQSLEKHGDIFDFSETVFGNWKEPINVRCRKCARVTTKFPQKQLNFGFCPTCNQSLEQRQITHFVSSIAPCVVDDQQTITPYELDIYIPTHNVAIEHHGLYWHSYNSKESKTDIFRHQQKALMCADKGIKLLQFFDFEWEQNNTLIKSMITNALGQSEPLNARSLDLKELNNQQSTEFFNKNHLYGHRHARYTLGLVDATGKVVEAMSFSKHHDGFEIIRLATEMGYHVRGGATRLITNFRRKHNVPIYTFADLRYSIGNTYRKLGFKESHITSPNYYYSKNGIIFSRQQCQKHKLSKFLENFDAEQTEVENMFAHGYRRFWDAGHIKFYLSCL